MKFGNYLKLNNFGEVRLRNKGVIKKTKLAICSQYFSLGNTYMGFQYTALLLYMFKIFHKITHTKETIN